MAGDRLAFECAPDLAAAAAAGERAAAWVLAAGGSPRVAQRAALVVEEVLANVASHGAGLAGSVASVRLARRADALLIEIDDAGRAFDPRGAPVPDIGASLEDRPVGGLGLHLVRSLAERLEYRREGDRNSLSVTLRWEG